MTKNSGDTSFRDHTSPLPEQQSPVLSELQKTIDKYRNTHKGMSKVEQSQKAGTAALKATKTGLGMANLANLSPNIDLPEFESIEECSAALLAFIEGKDNSAKAYEENRRRLENIGLAFVEISEGGLDIANTVANIPIIGDVAAFIGVVPAEKKYQAAKVVWALADAKCHNRAFLLRTYLSDIENYLHVIEAKENAIEKVDEKIKSNPAMNAHDRHILQTNIAELKQEIKNNKEKLHVSTEQAKAVGYYSLKDQDVKKDKGLLKMAQKTLDKADKLIREKRPTPFVPTQEGFGQYGKKYSSTVQDITILNKKNLEKAEHAYQSARFAAYSARSHLTSTVFHGSIVLMPLGAGCNIVGSYFGAKSLAHKTGYNYLSKREIEAAQAHQLNEFHKRSLMGKSTSGNGDSLLAMAQRAQKNYALSDEDTKKLTVILDHAHCNGGDPEKSFKTLESQFVYRNEKQRSAFINSLYEPISFELARNVMSKNAETRAQLANMSHEEQEELVQFDLVYKHLSYLDKKEFEQELQHEQQSQSLLHRASAFFHGFLTYRTGNRREEKRYNTSDMLIHKPESFADMDKDSTKMMNKMFDSATVPKLFEDSTHRETEELANHLVDQSGIDRQFRDKICEIIRHKGGPKSEESIFFVKSMVEATKHEIPVEVVQAEINRIYANTAQASVKQKPEPNAGDLPHDISTKEEKEEDEGEGEGGLSPG